jgi:hypothetical protein
MMRGSAELVDGILADPPRVHPGAPEDVWSTERDAYILLADLVDETSRTIETGCGVSTAVFAARRSNHTCVLLYENEADRFRAWADAHNVALDRMTFVSGESHLTLPALPSERPDLVFVDGGHVFPIPVIDWFYMVQDVHPGAVVFVDDLQLPAPRLVADYMESCAPAWECVRRTAKWGAYRLALLPPPESFVNPPAGSSLYGGNGRFERLGRRLDVTVRRWRGRR